MCPRIPRLVNFNTNRCLATNALDVSAGSREICHSTSDKINNAFTVRARIVKIKALNLLKGSISLVFVYDFSSWSVSLARVVILSQKKNTCTYIIFFY